MNHGRHRYSPFQRPDRERPYRDDEPERRRRPGDTILAEDDPVLNWSWDSVQKILRHVRGCRTCDDYVHHLQLASGERHFEQASLQREFNIQQVHGYALERGRQEAEGHRLTIRQLTDEIEALRKERDEARADLEDEKDARLKLEDELDDYHRGRSVTRSPTRSAYTRSRSNSQGGRSYGRRRSHSPRPRSHSPGPRRKTRSLSAPASRSPKGDVEMKVDQSPQAGTSQELPQAPADIPATASLLERMNVVTTGSPSLLSRIEGPHDQRDEPSLLMRMSEDPSHTGPSLLMRMSDEPMAAPEGEGVHEKDEKVDDTANSLPRPEDYEPGLGFLRSDTVDSSPIKDKAQLRWPATKEETRRLAAEAMRDGRRLALEHWGLFLRASNLGQVKGPPADAAKAMGWRKPEWVVQEHERRRKKAQDVGGSPKEKHNDNPREPPPFTSGYIQRWTAFLKRYPEFKIPGVLRNDDGTIATGKEDTLAGFLRVMELGPAPYYGPRMREWLRAVLEADWRDGSLLEYVRDLRGTESFPIDRTISRDTVRDFFLALTPPIAERLNRPQPDRAMNSIRAWTLSLSLMVPERFEINDDALDGIFGCPSSPA